jgi:hypothetical protein
MQVADNKRLLIAVGVVYALIQMILTVSVIVLQLDALNARKNAVKQRDYMTCILQIHPNDRSDDAIAYCKKITIDK